MTIINGVEKMRRIVELNRLAEEEYVQELRRSNPSLTEAEIKVEVQKWWLDKPEYWPEEFFRPISRERFKRMFGRDATTEEQQRMRLRSCYAPKQGPSKKTSTATLSSSRARNPALKAPRLTKEGWQPLRLTGWFFLNS